MVTAYAIMFGGALLLGGRMSDLLGRRRLFMAGLALFTVSSLLDGLAWSEGSLIAFRALQGLGAALLSPAALSILTTTFREGRERNVALGVWGAASGSGGAAGVLLGGALTSSLGWSWIFFINIPVGILLFAVSPWLLRESRAGTRPPALRRRRRGLDHRRADAARLRADARATQHGWGTASTIGLLAASAAPDRGVHRDRAALEGAAAADAALPAADARRRRTRPSCSWAAALFSQFFLLTLYMQQVLHYSAMQTGVAYIALTLAIIVVANVAQALVTRVGIRPDPPGRADAGARARSCCTRSCRSHGHYFWDLFPAFLIGGIGLALTFVPMVIGGADGRPAVGRGRRVGAVHHQPAGRRGDRRRRGDHDRDHVDERTTSTRIPGRARSSAGALTHGFSIAFYVLAGLAALGAVIVGDAVFIEDAPRSKPRRPVAEVELAEAA